MKTKIAVALALIGLGLSGCGKQAPSPPPAPAPSQAQPPAPPPPPPPPALTPASAIPVKAAPTGVPAMCAQSAGNKCVIAVTVTPGPDGQCDDAAVSLAEFVGLDTLAKHGKIEWQLPGGYQFCPRAGDGAFPNDVNLPDGVMDLDTNVKCSPSFTWKRKKKDGVDYAYTLRFRNSASTIACAKDPWLRN